MEPLTGIEPVNLFLTKEALYRLSYSGIRTRLKHSNEPGSFLLLSAHFLENQNSLKSTEPATGSKKWSG